jgi:predicted NBD/HSP70 family sugar kinase
MALTREVITGLKKGEQSSILQMVDNDYKKINHKIIVDAALNGDQFAINSLTDLGYKLGMGIAILVQILNPELIILGGRIAEAKEYLTIPIEQALFKYTIPNIREDMNIVVSKLGDKANLLGSVINVMENVFDS